MPKPHILLLGAAGQLGRALTQTLPKIGYLTTLTRAECDLGDGAQVRHSVRHLKPQVIVNAAAYTAVNAAETHIEQATRLNAILPLVLAQEAEHIGAWLVHYSTDYVFDGRKRDCYIESDAPNPLNVYGRTKLQGEKAIIAHLSHHLVLRTSWLFSAASGNFLTTILELARERDALHVVNDQHGTPTSADLVARCTAHMLARLLQGKGQPGLYHLASAGATTWHEYARYILDQAAAQGASLRCTSHHVHPVSSSTRADPATRPANSCLDSTKARRVYDLALPSWQQQVEHTVAQATSRWPT